MSESFRQLPQNVQDDLIVSGVREMTADFAQHNPERRQKRFKWYTERKAAIRARKDAEDRRKDYDLRVKLSKLSYFCGSHVSYIYFD